MSYIYYIDFIATDFSFFLFPQSWWLYMHSWYVGRVFALPGSVLLSANISVWVVLSFMQVLKIRLDLIWIKHSLGRLWFLSCCVGWRWDEVRWNEVRWGEVRWSDMRWYEVMWWDEVEVEEVEVIWCDVMWCDDVRWGEVMWCEVRWGELDWKNEVRCVCNI